MRTAELHALLHSGEPPTLIDVRETHEWAAGVIAGAHLISLGNLDARISEVAKDKATPIVLYCQSGVRSVQAKAALQALGYTNVTSAEGFAQWKEQFDIALPVVGDTRYSRHMLLPEVGEEGQARLAKSRVLLIGAGGLGSPAALYLAAAGVGTLGLVDHDRVDLSNLQRQVLHATARVGQPKVESAAITLAALNPDIHIDKHFMTLDASNVDALFATHDIIIDGSDNFPTRYVVNDAAIKHKKTVVHASVYRFEGMLSVFAPDKGPCYRCLYPKQLPADLVPSCHEAGVLGVLPGVMGMLQATETLKLLLGIGEPLIGRLLRYDSLAMRFSERSFQRNPTCPTCSLS